MIKQEHLPSAQAFGRAIAQSIQCWVDRQSERFDNTPAELWAMQMSSMEGKLNYGAKSGMDVLGILSSNGYICLPLPSEAKLFTDALIAGEYAVSEQNYAHLIAGLVTAASVGIAQ